MKKLASIISVCTVCFVRTEAQDAPIDAPPPGNRPAVACLFVSQADLPDYLIPRENTGPAELSGWVMESTPEAPGIVFTEEKSGLFFTELTQTLTDAVSSTHTFTLEVWLKPEFISLDGPARIISISDGTNVQSRNLTLGQSGSRYVVRIRTDSRSTENGFLVQEHTTHRDCLANEDQYVAVVYERCPHCGTALLSVFVDGKLEMEHREMNGTLSSWNPAMPFVVGNESSLDRQWLGAIRLFTFYERALSPEEIQQHAQLEF